MVVLPPEFVAIQYPGYFWNTADQKLYSIKVTGELKPLKLQKEFLTYGVRVPAGYRISHQGHKRTIPVEYLKTLVPSTVNQVIPVKSG